MKSAAPASHPLYHPAQAPEITLSAVSKTYPGASAPAVDTVTLRIPAGQITVLLGHSGCGKTTLLKMINRLIEADSGEIKIGGTEIHRFAPVDLRRGIGYVIQQVGLFPHMTAAQNIAVVPRLLGWDAPAIDRRVGELLEMVQLPQAYRARFPRQLSGGEQQRVGLARALAANPGMLLMDEPFGSLDGVTRRDLQDQMLQIQSRVGKTILFVTHDVEEALKLADQVAVLVAGRLAQAGAPFDVINRPAGDEVARLMDSGNVLQRLSLLTAADLLKSRPVGNGHTGINYLAMRSVDHRADLRAVLILMLREGAREICVTGPDGQPVGLIRFPDLQAILAPAADS